jgi:hypothetical protein
VFPESMCSPQLEQQAASFSILLFQINYFSSMSNGKGADRQLQKENYRKTQMKPEK